jgi:predicted dehydrogenase/threonine dehydrogenase-like Zn-dependent dehydrogenase
LLRWRRNRQRNFAVTDGSEVRWIGPPAKRRNELLKQVFIKNGAAVVEDVPAPAAEPGEVLVRVASSCISVGTEMSGVQAASEPIWKRAARRPDKVLKAINMLFTRGVDETVNIVRGQIGSGSILGYSAAGTVVGVGASVDDIDIGERVACAGAQSAHHAEVIRVPRNLVVPVPDAVKVEDAATMTLGAIALQGVRRAEPTLGETFVVVGLGLLGQLTSQMLKANGCRVVGIDLDPRRVALAKACGLDIGLAPTEDPPIVAVAKLTDGVGADGVIVTAASKSAEALALACKLCRRKGRVVLVGDVPIQIDRADIYRNEIDFRISTSYGPGRYDRRYEEEGLEYPIGYVRWTENRNMRHYLTLIASGQVTPSKFVDATYSIDDAPKAYDSLRPDPAGGPRPLSVLLSYPKRADEAAVLSRRALSMHAMPIAAGAIRVGLAGAGAFARSVHLPNMAAAADKFHIRAVMSRTGHTAHNVANNQRADYATTDFNQLLDDKDIDLILISSRHDSHGDYTLRALEAGKHVFVEKPLTLDPADLDRINRFYGDNPSGKPLLLTGFNRRFSPAATAVIAALCDRNGPMVVNYRMNAGYLPLDHWVHGREGGGRNLGEACHIYDLFNALTGSRARATSAVSIGPVEERYARNDNFVATIRYEDGSVCTLTYTALGDPAWPKEQMEVFCDRIVYAMDDYKALTVKGRTGLDWSGNQDKGHVQELAALAEALSSGGDWPIPLWQQIQATQIAFDVERAVSGAT